MKYRNAHRLSQTPPTFSYKNSNVNLYTIDNLPIHYDDFVR